MLDPQPPVGEVVAGRGKLLPLPRLLSESLDDADPREHPGKRGHLLARGVPQPVVARVDMPPEDPRAEDHQRHRDEGEEGELGVDPDEHRPHPHQLHDLEEKAPGDLVHEAVEDLAVVGDPADHRPNLMPVVVGDGEILELVDHLLAERAGEPGADRVGKPPLEHTDDREEDPGERQRQHNHEQRGLEVGQRVDPRLLQRPGGEFARAGVLGMCVDGVVHDLGDPAVFAAVEVGLRREPGHRLGADVASFRDQ